MERKSPLYYQRVSQKVLRHMLYFKMCLNVLAENH